MNKKKCRRFAKVWINLPYLVDKGDHLTKNFIRKLKKCFHENVEFIKL